MATTTTNFGWDIPQSTDLVKDGATAIAALGQDIDTAMVDLKGGTTGQVLAKASGTDLDFSWVAQDDSNAIQNAIVDAKGDLIGATAADTPARLAVGTNGQVLTADSTAATGIKWATPAPASSALTFIKSQTIGSGVNTVTVTDAFSATYDNYLISVINSDGSADGMELRFRLGATTTNYYSSFYLDRATTATASTIRVSNGSAWTSGLFSNTDDSTLNMDVYAPYLTKRTAFTAMSQANQFSGWSGGQLQDTTSYTAFTILLVDPGAATFSGGTIRVYGYQNS
jgi:hypothetical protein